MGKIKLNLVSGAVVEKPLINAFKANNSSYIVLDNEMNGSMGLPIILVCKYDNGKLVKILDQNEWGIVKEYLKNIIAGNQIEFISVEQELLADDIYYTQLTLPVPSFDALKNAYKVETVVTPEISVEKTVSEPVVEMPMNNIPNVEPILPVVDVQPVVEPSVMSTVEPIQEDIVMPSAPVIDIPVAPQVEVTPVDEVSFQNIQPVIEPEITPTPIIEPVMSVAESTVEVQNEEMSIFKEQKEAFMQACENMFDALVQKFEKELENRK